MKKVSVIICTKNRKEDLEIFIDSLNKQTEHPAEFIIVDASFVSYEYSFENSFNLEDSKFIYIHVPESRGLTYQRNLGIKASSSDVLCFFDDDTILDENYIKILKESFLNQEIIGFTGNITNEKRKNFFLDFYNKLFLLTEFNNGDGRFKRSFFYNMPFSDSENEKFVEFTPGCCMAFLRDKLIEAGSFDEDLIGYSMMEDGDASYRVSRLGKILYRKDAKIIHNKSQNERLNKREYFSMLLKNHKYFYQKNIENNFLNNLAFHYSRFGLRLKMIFK